MGDVLTLIDKAQSDFDEKEAEAMAKRLEENKFDLNDLLEQMKQVRKMGSLSQILSMLPGANKVSDEEKEQGEKQMTRMESIINSMTKREREKPDIINPARKRRIAAGSGSKVEDVNRLLNQYKQMQKMFKAFSGKPGKKGRRGPRLSPDMMRQLESMGQGWPG
jgi:signal recognition particle subunit SRP54